MSDLTMSMFLRKEDCAEARGWQPIETAPTDSVILFFPHYMAGYWDHGGEFWRLCVDIPLTSDLKIAGDFGRGTPWMEVAADAFGMPAPTHWQPLPEPPQ